MVWAKLVGSLVEVLGEVLHDSQVAGYGILSVITTLEFLQRHFPKLGHRDLLVTHKISLRSADCLPLIRLGGLATWRENLLRAH